MINRCDDLSDIVRSVHASGGRGEAIALANDMVTAGLAWLRILKGARHCADTLDQLSQDFTGEVLGQPPRRRGPA